MILTEWSKRKLNLMIDSSGIRIIGRSIWFCIRIKEYISKKECDKAHLAVCSDVFFIMNWRITNGKKNDCPYFRKLLKPFRILGIILADKGYLSRANFQFAVDRKGCAFIPFKKGKKKERDNDKISLSYFHLIFYIYQLLYIDFGAKLFIDNFE